MEIVEIWQNLEENATQIMIFLPNYMRAEYKSEAVGFSRAQSLPYCFCVEEILKGHYCKYLGVKTDKKLNFKDHIKHWLNIG